MNQERKPAGLILAAGFSSRMKDFKPLMKIGRHNPLEILIRHFKREIFRPIIIFRLLAAISNGIGLDAEACVRSHVNVNIHIRSSGYYGRRERIYKRTAKAKRDFSEADSLFIPGLKIRSFHLILNNKK